MELTIGGENTEILLTFSSDLQKKCKIAENILKTDKHSCPFMRDFGLDLSVLDGNLEAGKAEITRDILSQFKQYLPEFKIRRILWNQDVETGAISPVLDIYYSEV